MKISTRSTCHLPSIYIFVDILIALYQLGKHQLIAQRDRTVSVYFLSFHAIYLNSDDNIKWEKEYFRIQCSQICIGFIIELLVVMLFLTKLAFPIILGRISLKKKIRSRCCCVDQLLHEVLWKSVAVLQLLITWKMKGIGMKTCVTVQMGQLFWNGPSKIGGRQLLKNLKWYGLLRQTISLQIF